MDCWEWVVGIIDPREVMHSMTPVPICLAFLSLINVQTSLTCNYRLFTQKKPGSLLKIDGERGFLWVDRLYVVRQLWDCRSKYAVCFTNTDINILQTVPFQWKKIDLSRGCVQCPRKTCTAVCTIHLLYYVTLVQLLPTLLYLAVVFILPTDPSTADQLNIT